MGATKKIESRTYQFIDSHARLKASGKMVTHGELAKIIGVESKTTITEILKKRQNIQPEQWEAFRKYFKISSDYYVPENNIGEMVVKEPAPIYFIELKTASGKAIKVNPENEITLLNAFLEERDRVIDEKNQTINTIKEEKQARIDELKQDKEELYKLLNSDLNDISKATNLIFAMARTALQYHAHVASGGNPERENELLDSLSIRIGDNLKVDAKQDSAVSLSTSGK